MGVDRCRSFGSVGSLLDARGAATEKKTLSPILTLFVGRHGLQPAISACKILIHLSSEVLFRAIEPSPLQSKSVKEGR